MPHRALAAPQFVYAGLSAALWGFACSFMGDARGALRCGNELSDPCRAFANIAPPIAALFLGALVVASAKARRWPALTIAAIATFAITSATLAYGGYILEHDYGHEIGKIWWMP